MSDLSPNCTILSRGGVLVRTRNGPVQFGIPPETIKDTMLLEEGVPSVFVLARDLFDFERAVSLADVEFPIYYNFFFRGQRVTVVCEPHQRARITRLIQEVLFPPVPDAVHLEYAGGAANPTVPDMAKELAFFQRHPKEPHRAFTLDDIIEFIEIPADGQVRINPDTEIRLHRDRLHFEVLEAGQSIARIPWDLSIPLQPLVLKQAEPFTPPMFGVTALGTGSGFDPTSSTSGFVLWVHRRGIMVDPPVDSTLNLREERIHPKLIQEVILTHVHADHDAGVLQKVLEDGVIRLYTTPTIMDAFLRKSCLLTGLPRERLEKMILFQPIPVGTPFNILGAKFTFRYNLHSIPTIGFKMEFAGRSIAYSSDILNVPEKLEEIHREGILSRARYEDLVAFPWEADLIIHEAGFPPLHTPPMELDKLPDDIKARLYLVHTVEARITAFPRLRLMGHGIENTLSIDVPETPASQFFQILKTLSAVDFLRDLPVGRTADLVEMAERRRLEAGQYLIRKGELGDELYIILHGEVSVVREDREYKIYGPSDIVGDMALVNDEPRFADVIARSDVLFLAIRKSDFMPLVAHSGFLEYLRQLARVRKEDSWPLLAGSLFDVLNVQQLTQVQALMTRCRFKRGEPMCQSDDLAPYGYLVISGLVDVYLERGGAGTLGAGAFIGYVPAPDAEDELPRSHAVAAGTVDAYRMSTSGLRWFLERNPGVWLRLVQRCRYEYQLRKQREVALQERAEAQGRGAEAVERPGPAAERVGYSSRGRR